MLRRLAVLVMTAWWWLSVSPDLEGDVHTRNYPVQQFKSFVEAARRYIELSKGEPLIHRNVVKAINGLTDLLEADRKRVPGDVLREAERLECLLFDEYDSNFEGDEPPGL